MDDNCQCRYCRYTELGQSHSAWSSGCETCGGLVDDIIGLLTMAENPHNRNARTGHNVDEDPGGDDAYGPMTRALYLNKCIPACPEGCLALRNPALYAMQDQLVTGVYDAEDGNVAPWDVPAVKVREIAESVFAAWDLI